MSKLELNAQYHKEHQEWLSQLDFYYDEIKVFQKELSLIMDIHPNQFSIAEHSEEYNKIFRKKLDDINKLKLQLQLHEHELSKGEDPMTEELWDHEATRVKVLEFVTKIEKLKKNFRRFVSRQM
jgi:Asp-tRNA(Asn)/Glu-tRNA(Gln) amidotransferase C subunit